MDITLLIIGFILMFIGIAGAILPVIPGTPISWIGLLLLHLTTIVEINWWFLGITFVIAIGIYILDYVIPAMGTKRFGGTKAGAWGAIIGLFIGIFIPIPFGILIGSFLGALFGEMIISNTTFEPALKAAFGSFIGFLASTVLKVMATFAFLALYCYKAYENWDAISPLFQA
ncbi:hypothetical protein SCB49_03469 [unidentified eubacterium SCB49]|nr:hypothetical protein SCB49_03469 [unidentified eubacterium SCB49]